MNTTLPTHRSSASTKALSVDLNSTLVIIDPGVADVGKLVAGVLPEATAIVLDPAQDGVLQITKALSARPAVTRLHLVCHGEPGRLFLGNTQLSLETLERYAWDLQAWFSPCSSAAPTLLLYGCHVAAGAIGAEFLEHLHHLTRASIAASTSRTGSATEGGNWELEVSIGSVDRTLAFHPATLENYPATLATINGKVWRDLDADGIEDVGEPQLQGVTVYLDADSDGQLDAGETSTVTDASGSYTFTDLPAGTYTVAQVLQSGWQQTAPISVSSITNFRFAGGDNGDRLQPTGDGIALAGYTTAQTTNQAAIVIGNSRRTIVNGFSVDAALSDAEGLALATKEIQHLSAGVSNVLIFHALQGGESTTLFQTAAANLGLTSQVYTDSDVAGFEAAVTAADPSNTLVIFTNENDDSGLTGLINHVNAGGRAILYFWYLNSNAALASAFQVATVADRFSPEPIYSWSNSTVTAVDGATATVDFGTFIPNAAPTSANKTVSTNEDTLYAFQSSDFAFADTDDSDSLTTVKIASLPGAGDFFLDGDMDDSLDSGEAITLNQEIAVADLSNLKFKPAENANGTGYATFQFQVSDSKAYSSNYTITVDVAAQNDAPVITEGVTASVNLDEDSSPQAFALTLNATDVEQDTLTWSIKTAAINGTASVDSSGKVSYTPNANYNGNDSFDVQVSDGKDGVDTITVNVNIAPQQDAPTAQDKTLQIAENSVYIFKSSDFSFSDIDQGDSLQEVQITSLPSAGTLLYDGQAVTLDQEIAVADLGKLTFAPTSDDNGQSYANIGFKVGDGKDYSSQAHTITVDVIDDSDSPIIAEGTAVTVKMDEDGAPTGFALSLSATDADKDPLFWSVKTGAAHGAVEINTTGKVSYVPTANYNGSDGFEIEVNDGNGNADTISVTVDIAAQNDAPTSQNGSVTTNENKQYSFKLTDFGFADVDSGDIFKAIKITALETAGELFLDLNGNGLSESSEAIALNQKIDAADLGNLKFQSAVSENDALSQFSFQVSDGIAYSDQSYTMAINITTQVKLPVGEQPTLQPKPDLVIGETGIPTPVILFRGKGNRKGSKIQGSKRSEKIQGTPLRDVIFGNDGNDRISPGFRGERFGNDRLFGGKGNDIINGGKGNDWLEGNDGNDLLLGDKGRDQIDGGAGNDIVFGGKGDDIIIGGSGDDTLTGGNDRDMFVYSSVTVGRDTIKDFNVKEDLLDLRGIFKQGYVAENSFAQYQKFVKLEQVEMGVAVKIDTDGTGKTFELLATLNNVTTSDLSSKNFVIA